MCHKKFMLHKIITKCFYQQLFVRTMRQRLNSSSLSDRLEAIQMLIRLGDAKGLSHTLHHPDAFTRQEGVKGLVQLRGARAERHLMKALSDQSREVARVAAQCLANLKADRKLLAALQRCTYSDDWVVRFFGAQGLARLGSVEARFLLEQLQYDENEYVRESAKQGLQEKLQK
jgi:HEAT repeat protein